MKRKTWTHERSERSITSKYGNVIVPPKTPPPASSPWKEPWSFFSHGDFSVLFFLIIGSCCHEPLQQLITPLLPLYTTDGTSTSLTKIIMQICQTRWRSWHPLLHVPQSQTSQSHFSSVTRGVFWELGLFVFSPLVFFAVYWKDTWEYLRGDGWVELWIIWEVSEMFWGLVDASSKGSFLTMNDVMTNRWFLVFLKLTCLPFFKKIFFKRKLLMSRDYFNIYFYFFYARSVPQSRGKWIGCPVTLLLVTFSPSVDGIKIKIMLHVAFAHDWKLSTGST